MVATSVGHDCANVEGHTSATGPKQPFSGPVHAARVYSAAGQAASVDSNGSPAKVIWQKRLPELSHVRPKANKASKAGRMFKLKQ